MAEPDRRPGRYTMRDTCAVAREATRIITSHLRAQPDTILVNNVERDPYYQRIDVDLIWRLRCPEGGRGFRNIRIEIKADRLDFTGNFFFETWSNREHCTPGCFLYTEAEYLYYYFIAAGALYVLPIPSVRPWFVAHLNDFIERGTTTSVAAGQRHYTTVGRLVPIGRVLAEVDGVEMRLLTGDPVTR